MQRASSQSGEDIWAYNNLFYGKKNGIFLEMGALDGVKYSNTLWMEKEAGWRGVLIEPSTGKKQKGNKIIETGNFALRGRPLHNFLSNIYAKKLINAHYLNCVDSYANLTRNRPEALMFNVAICSNFTVVHYVEGNRSAATNGTITRRNHVLPLNKCIITHVCNTRNILHV